MILIGEIFVRRYVRILGVSVATARNEPKGKLTTFAL